MKRKIVHFLLLAALVAVSSLALADPPTRVGRMSVVEGQVTLDANGDEQTGNLLNWPVTTGNHVTTAPGARAEFRIGSSAVRVDGDSDVEIIALDEESMRLRLNYGTASVRIRDGQDLGGFDLTTPQARVVMTQPGTVRVDTERAPDTTVVSVLAGAAQVQSGNEMVTGGSGKRIEVRGDEFYTSLAVRDRFDDWVQTRDRREEGLPATRYIPTDVTGYEELDQYGSWADNNEYGALWTPRLVPVGWAPYRDGRWVWVDPWGWTWVDNSPWGYAPFHYGRWVVVNNRWCWAPGRWQGRPVWAPALVGWVGGANWSVTFGSRSGPGVGWYPLTPRDHFVPSYRVTTVYENRVAWRHRSDDRWQERWVDRNHDGRRDGVTVLPRDQFEHRRSISVANVPRGQVTPAQIRNVPQAPAPRPQITAPVRPGNVAGRPDWRERERENQQRDNRGVENRGDQWRDRIRADNQQQRNEQQREQRQERGAEQRFEQPRNVISTNPQAGMRQVPAPQPQQGILSTTPPPAARQQAEERDRMARQQTEERDRNMRQQAEERDRNARQAADRDRMARQQTEERDRNARQAADRDRVARQQADERNARQQAEERNARQQAEERNARQQQEMRNREEMQNRDRERREAQAREIREARDNRPPVQISQPRPEPQQAPRQAVPAPQPQQAHEQPQPRREERHERGGDRDDKRGRENSR